MAGASDGWVLRAWLPIVACAIPWACAAQGARGPAAAAASAAAQPASVANGRGVAGAAPTPATAASAGNGGGTRGRAAADADAAAMERARRAAESPLRAILEAGKVRRRYDGDGAAEVDGAPPRPVPGTIRPVVAADSPVLTIRTLPAEPGVAASAARMLDPASPTSVAELPARAPAALLTRPVPEVRQPPPLSQSPAAATTRGPELLHMVEPVATPRALEQLTRPEVAVEFTIGADGRVSDVQVQPPVPLALVSRIVQAVEQWRYAPSAASRRHRVQLVFKPGG